MIMEKIKYSLIVTVIVCIYMVSYSANYYKEGTIWHLTYSSGMPQFEEYEGSAITLEKIKNDSIGTYLKMQWNFPDGTSRDLGEIISEGEKVYKYYPEIGEKYLMYDFSLKEGDTADVYFGDFWDPVNNAEEQDLFRYRIIRDVDVMPSNPENVVGEYKITAISYYEHDRGSINSIWIDGVGIKGFPLYNISGQVSGMGVPEFWVESDGEVIYRSNEKAAIDSEIPDDGQEYPAYNLNGIPCDRFGTGIKIVNGKKIL